MQKILRRNGAMGKMHLKNKTTIFPECRHSTAHSITCRNKSINNYKIVKDSMFTRLKTVNPSPRLEKIPCTQQKYPVNYS